MFLVGVEQEGDPGDPEGNEAHTSQFVAHTNCCFFDGLLQHLQLLASVFSSTAQGPSLSVGPTPSPSEEQELTWTFTSSWLLL